MPQVFAYACDDKTSVFHRTTIEIREPADNEIYFDIQYAGICHSDIHTARGEWGPVHYPLVPGHELVGVVKKVGDKVTKFKVGDKVGVGCMFASCKECEYCKAGEEQFCSNPHAYFTYGTDQNGNPTTGGYAQGFTVREDFACRIPEAIPFETSAPLLCAGITTYSPLKRWQAGPGKKVAVLGMGGLGHMGVQIAAAMGAEVHVISHSRSKEEDGKRLGASYYHATSEPGTLEALRDTFDIILCTVSASDLDYTAYLNTLKPYGVFVDVGLPEEPASINLSALVHGNRVMAGSMIGGIDETQEMLDFCAEHGIHPVIEMIGGEDITEAYNKVTASQVRYRYVIDTATFND
ncbi:GroES-like protein [Alloscardovia omnicolens]|uniref:NAD(P)-dependent alcohol dehydrogenase n=1 Tax=Alloscardovia omnicolens TaxID=419015 RepID=UPI0007641BB8|nr:NAD(P)-dependent alcohol dehydrogenase [Alloscardovia omnicolens]KWZ75748.1 GroES-like protein [Alloscardovia omnicolens]